MKWKHPSRTKIYEALGAVADGRVILNGNEAKVYSSSKNKYYNVTFDPSSSRIMCNDNSSYWKGELGYPSIAYLMLIGKLSIDIKVAEILKDIPWKDINQKFKNNFDEALEYILKKKSVSEREILKQIVEKIDGEIRNMDLELLGEKVLPPSGY